MKKVFLTLFIINILLFLSCKHSQEDKFKSAIEDEMRADFKIEHIKIDSLHYSLGNLQDYYIEDIHIENQYIKDITEILETSRHNSFNDKIVRLSHDIDYSTKKVQYLTDLIMHLPSSKDIYTIDYYIDYQTDKSNYHGHETDYLYSKDLSHVSINTDSLFKNNPAYTTAKYDSIAEVQILRENDNLAALEKKLSRELELRIAGGTNQATILDYKIKINNAESKIAHNKVDYYWLFMY